jgi:hypothetical protein
MNPPHKAISGIHPGTLDRGVFARAGITPRDVVHHRLTYDPSIVCNVAGCFSFNMLFLIVGAAVIQLSTSVRPPWPKETGVANMKPDLKGKRQELDGYLLAVQYLPVISKDSRRFRVVVQMTDTRFFYPGAAALKQYWTGPTVEEEMEDYMMEQINKDD